MKVKKGSSFFLKVRNLYCFCINLSNKSDEDGEYKIVRTRFCEFKNETLKQPLSHVEFFDFKETEEISIEDWDSNSIKSLTNKWTDNIVESAVPKKEVKTREENIQKDINPNVTPLAYPSQEIDIEDEDLNIDMLNQNTDTIEKLVVAS